MHTFTLSTPGWFRPQIGQMASPCACVNGQLLSKMASRQDKELAGKIGSEVLFRSREIVKKHMFVGEHVCRYYVAELYPMVSQELHWWTKIARRGMKATSCLSHPWQVCIVRNMHQDVFELIRLTIIKCVARKTRCVEQLEITTKKENRKSYSLDDSCYTGNHCSWWKWRLIW